MKLKRHHRKNIVTDLYTLEYNDQTFYYIKHTTGSGKKINEEIRKQNGNILDPNSLYTKHFKKKLNKLLNNQ